MKKTFARVYTKFLITKILKLQDITTFRQLEFLRKNFIFFENWDCLRPFFLSNRKFSDTFKNKLSLKYNLNRKIRVEEQSSLSFK